MSSFSMYEYIKEKHAGVFIEIKMEDIAWPNLFECADKSIFITGGEFYKGDGLEDAKKCARFARDAFDRNPEYFVSVMCGPWLFASAEIPGDEDPRMNNILRELRDCAMDHPNTQWIKFYYNPLNALESIESGYFHSIVINEGDPDSQTAYLERPHGPPQRESRAGDPLYKREWIMSTDQMFVRDVIQIRESFRRGWGIEPLRFEELRKMVAPRTFMNDDFYVRHTGWAFEDGDGFDRARNAWRNGTLLNPEQHAGVSSH